MIKNLQIKFIIIAMCSMLLVLTTIMTGLNIANYIGITRDADHLLTMIEENNGNFPEPPKEQDMLQKDAPKDDMDTKEAPYSTRFFTVWLNKDGKITKTHLEHIASITENEARTFAKEINASKKNSGLKGIYRYKKVSTDDGCMIIFLNRRNELTTFRKNLFTSITISLTGLLAVFALVMFFSKIVFRPVKESYQKQKRFITDAGHEIKTPLTIIDANVEVIEMLDGENEWTKSIRNQIKRLSSLTKHLVMLSKLEEDITPAQKELFSLSDLLEESIQSFSALALTGKKTLESDIEKDINYTGDEKAISQLVGLLIDNALKYSIPESTIHISLKRQKRKIRFEIQNKAEDLPKGDLGILFERFYRLDSSRNSKTGGSGIGLSVAHAIVESHKGQITANSPDGKSLSIVIKL